MGSMGSRAPKIPAAAAVAAPVTAEDENVKDAADAVKRRIRAQQGRQSTFLVPVGAKTKSLVGD